MRAGMLHTSLNVMPNPKTNSVIAALHLIIVAGCQMHGSHMLSD